MTHTIRLRGHWEATPAGSGTVRWSRRFGRPTGVGDGIISLRVTTAIYPCRVAVNEGEPVDIVGSEDAVNLLSLLPRNVVVIESAGELMPEAVLDIRVKNSIVKVNASPGPPFGSSPMPATRS